MNQPFHNGHRKRVVITGMGAITPLGNDVETTWENMMQGVSGIERIAAYEKMGLPVQIAGPVKDFDPSLYMNKKDVRRLGPFIQYAIAAARQAVEQAGLNLSQEDPTRIGLEVSSALGGLPTIEEQSVKLYGEGYKSINPTLIPSTLINMAACFIGIELNLQGPTNAPVNACATGVTAVGEAMRRIVWGDADVMLAGATESTLNPLAVAGFARLGALSTRNDTPTRAITPFDASRDGTVIGEGGAVLVLESLEHAQARGAKILGEIVGYAMTGDAYHIAAPAADGHGAIGAMRNALRDARLEANQINYIAAHGTGTPLNDASETKAVKAVFGEAAYDLSISSIKSMTGHTLGAAGAIACVTILKAMDEGRVPPTAGLLEPDPDCDLNYVPNEPQAQTLEYAMANAFGFGGQNASIVLKRWQNGSA
jgi:3-oxoacyl-[acyl-carrier-protein] synthase II